MSDTERLRCLMLVHGRRVRRIWLLGATLTFLIGLSVCIATLLKEANDGAESMDEYGRIRYSETRSKEGLQAAAAVGIGFTLMLVVMGNFAFFIYKRGVEKGDFIEVEIEQESSNALLETILSVGAHSLLGNIIPGRIFTFSYEDGGAKKAQMSGLFADETPCAASEPAKYYALKNSMFGAVYAQLVCERSMKQHQD